MAETGRPPAAPLSRRDARLVALLVTAVLALVLIFGYALQSVAQRGSVTTGRAPPAGLKQQREIDKLTADVKRIRSDTVGSLYWLKLAGVFVTVGAAVGGYLVAQSRSSRERFAAEEKQTQRRLDFERRSRVDAAFQAMVQELSSDRSALLRATAAMKLGKLLEAPPVEWGLEAERRDELWALTKQILAASLALEDDAKVRKALTIAIVLHGDPEERANLRGLDFSTARAADAYWARGDFTYADFYRADLTDASFRRAVLSGAQFRETILTGAVLAEAECRGTNFKFTDLRHANLSGTDLTGAIFDRSKVNGLEVAGATLEIKSGYSVDLSPNADGSDIVEAEKWLAQAS